MEELKMPEETTKTDLMNNPGFESWDEPGPDGWETDAVKYSGEFVRSGQYSARVPAENGGIGTNLITAGYDTSQTVSAGIWVYLENLDDAYKISLILEDIDNDGNTASVQLSDPAPDWNLLKIDNIYLGGSGYRLRFEVEPGTAGDVYFDDAFFYGEEKIPEDPDGPNDFWGTAEINVPQLIDADFDGLPEGTYWVSGICGHAPAGSGTAFVGVVSTAEQAPIFVTQEARQFVPEIAGLSDASYRRACVNGSWTAWKSY
jgi:hypothetical protein